MRWIQQHDKFTNDLPGSIPVAPGVTVLLTKHLDRGSKSLLKGRRGTIDSVEPDPREPPIDPNDTERHRFRYLPKIVYVKFDNASWKLAGLEPGVYPVRPHTPLDWYTDQAQADRQKRRPGGKVKRRQFPITAGLAATIHWSQGKTGRFMLLLDAHTSAMAAYVALTRSRGADDVLLLAPFAKEIFQRGPINPFNDALLQHLRTRGTDGSTPSGACEDLRALIDLNAHVHVFVMR